MKRARPSVRAAITFSPARISSCQSGARSLRPSMPPRFSATDLIGASELLSSWPSTRISRCHAWRSSSRSARLRSLMTQHLIGQAGFSKTAAMNFPAARFARERGLHDARRFAAQAIGQPQVRRACGREGASAGPIQDAFARAVDAGAGEPSPSKAKHGDIDFLHHLAQKRRRFQSAQPLLPQGLAERVYFAQHFAERVTRGSRRAPGSRSRLRAAPRAGWKAYAAERPRGSAALKAKLSHAERHQNRQRPLELGRVAAGPQENDGDDRASQPRRKGAGTECAVRTKRASKTVFLQAPIERAAAQAQRFAGMADVAAVAGQRLLNQNALHFFDAHFLEREARLRAPGADRDRWRAPAALAPSAQPARWSGRARGRCPARDDRAEAAGRQARIVSTCLR